MMSKINIIQELKNTRLPVIISGAGIVGKMLLSICEEEGIAVECFCDSSTKAASSKFCGRGVIYTPDLKSKYQDAAFLISVASIKDVVDLLGSMGFSRWHAGGLLLKDMDFSQSGLEASIDYTKFAIENCIICHDGYLNPDKLFFRSIDLIITERCSLRCKDCSNLMQYYEKPKNCDMTVLLKSVDAFFKMVDEVMDFRVIGGETFVNKEWHMIVAKLTDEPRAKRIVLYTNGTIIPDREYIPLLKNDKVLVIATDYGPLSRKLVELKNVMEENRIAYHVLKANEWLDCSSITWHNRGVDGNMEIYRLCCAKNMATLSDGKLFRCPYSANAFRLSAVPDCKDDYIDLFKEPPNIQTKNKVRDYILHKDYMNTCDYCSGRPLSGSEVKPAVQVQKPLAYDKYHGADAN